MKWFEAASAGASAKAKPQPAGNAKPAEKSKKATIQKTTDPGIKTTSNPFAALEAADEDDGFTAVTKSRKR